MSNNDFSSNNFNIPPTGPNQPPSGSDGRLLNAPTEPHPNVPQMGPSSGNAHFSPPTNPTHFFGNPQMVFASKKDRSKWLYEFAGRLDGTEKRTAEKQRILQLLEKDSAREDITYTTLIKEYEELQRKNEEFKKEQADCPEFNSIEAEAGNSTEDGLMLHGEMAELLVDQEVADQLSRHQQIKVVLEMPSEIPANCPAVPESTHLTPTVEVPDDRHPLIAFSENSEVFLNETIAHFEKGLLEKRERLKKLFLDFSQLEVETKQRAAHLEYNRSISRARQGMKRKLQPDA